jgi:putative phosphoribosyl transferase
VTVTDRVSAFRDRVDAGRLLAERLKSYANRPDVLVLALPRGGVPVAFEVACALNAPLDAFNVRKLCVPWEGELAIGAIATGGMTVVDEPLVQELRITQDDIEAVRSEEQKELERLEKAYRGNRPPAALKGRTIILVDDGIATGSTVRAAIKALRSMNPARIVVAAPVVAAFTYQDMKSRADEVICVKTTVIFLSIGAWYECYPQVTDEQVARILEQAIKADAAHLQIH